MDGKLLNASILSVGFDTILNRKQLGSKREATP